jgi:hypothetical protein
MSIIGCNCRGVGYPCTVHGLKYLVHVYKADVLFLSEVLSIDNKMEELCYMLGFDYYFSVNLEVRGGGLALCGLHFIVLSLISPLIMSMWKWTIT